MATFEVALIAVDVRKWDMESQRISLNNFFVMDKEERSYNFDVTITEVAGMVEEYLGKLLIAAKQKIKQAGLTEEDNEVVLANDSFLRQKMHSYFKKITSELNNPRRKRSQNKVIFSTHLDLYAENQDISFLPDIMQFYVALNWARKYYEKEEYQRAIEPLRKLVKIRPDFGLGYKLLARSYKKIRKYDDAMANYEKYATIDNSTEAWLELAQSLRKGKIFDRSLEIYKDVISKAPDNRDAKIGLAQIYYSAANSEYLNILDDLYKSQPDWLKKWLISEFNFRIYTMPKTLLLPNQASAYLGHEKVFDLTQRAFKNEVPSHFNPSRARLNFFKEELDQWALVMNRFRPEDDEIVLYPQSINLKETMQVNEDFENEPDIAEKIINTQESKASSRVEGIIQQILAKRKAGAIVIKDSVSTAGSTPENSAAPKKRGRKPGSTVAKKQGSNNLEGNTKISEKLGEASSLLQETLENVWDKNKTNGENKEEKKPARRGRPRKKEKIFND